MLKPIYCTIALLTCLVCATPAIAGYTQCRNRSTESPDLRYCLRRGDSGPMIRSLTEDLREAGYWRGNLTSQFTEEVEQAIMRFQRDYETIPESDWDTPLSIDGIVGPATQVRLCQAVGRGCGPDDPLGCYTGSPRLVIDCLESYGGEPYPEPF